jgi:hypothetical protein
MKMVVNYVRVAATFGLVRSAVVLHHTPHIEVHNVQLKKYEQRELLPTEWVGGMVLGTLLTASCLPIVVVRDLRKLDLAAHGRYHLERKQRVPRSACDAIMLSIYE